MTPRRAVVGGGSSGLGYAVAESLASQGCDLLLWARSDTSLQKAAASIQTSHPDIQLAVVAADASRPEAAARIADAAMHLWGGADILILNSGGPPACAPDETDADGWRAALQLLTVTPIDLATRLLPAMRSARWGRIIAVLSTGVREPLADLSYSNGGRAALAAWLKTIASEVAVDEVTVNGILPGRIDTDRVTHLDTLRAAATKSTLESVRAQSSASIPVGRYGRAQEFAAVAAFLASEAASYVTGSFFSCDGGLARGRW